MLTFAIAVVVGLITFFATVSSIGVGWGITASVAVTIAILVIMNRLFAQKLTAIGNQVSALLEDGQNEAMRLARRFQTKPIGSQKVMQTQIEKKVEDSVIKALELLETAQPYYKWSLLAERQIATLQVQLNYRIQRFEAVDMLMDKVLLMEPITVAMKLARQYKTDSGDMEKTFRKGVKKFKYEKGVLLYALYSWILVKRKEFDAALAVLDEAKQKTDDETLARNWQYVANNKIHMFSNAGIGEQWYALHLEQPPRQKASKGMMKGNPMIPKGKNRYR